MVQDSSADLSTVYTDGVSNAFVFHLYLSCFGERDKPVGPEKGLIPMGKWVMFEYCVLNTSHYHMSLFYPINPVLCDPDVQQPVPARLPCPLRPVSAFICVSQVTKRPSQWINIKILFRGIRLGNILPSNAALARAKARQGINY